MSLRTLSWSYLDQRSYYQGLEKKPMDRSIEEAQTDSLETRRQCCSEDWMHKSTTKTESQTSLCTYDTQKLQKRLFSSEMHEGDATLSCEPYLMRHERHCLMDVIGHQSVFTQLCEYCLL